ncbi:hypothetical protein [Nonomuraea sp. GTA35]|uniref:hypothetical protein n=1 Tax=Nonomuraea sp. GTA35 TaxID=1676746 RepID=UPI0035C0DFEC
MTARLTRLLLATTGASVAALVIGLLSGGAAFTPTIAGLADSGAVTRWRLPAAKLAANLSAVVTIGALLMAAVLLPSDKGLLSAEASRYARLASRAAPAWAVATMLFTLSDIMAVPVIQLPGPAVISFITSIPQGALAGALIAAAALRTRAGAPADEVTASRG